MQENDSPMYAYRKLVKTDLSSAAAIYAAAFDEPWGEAALLDLLRMQGAYGFIATYKGSDVSPDTSGFVLARYLFEEAEILTIAVNPTSQGKGIAKELMAAAQKYASDKGAEKMFLEVAADNRAARSLYHKLGYEELSVRKGYYRRVGGKRIDAHNMSKTLKL